MTIHFKHTVASMRAKFPNSASWSEDAQHNTLNATMCGIPAMRQGKPVSVGQHSDNWQEVTCERCRTTQANCDKVLANGWAGKAVRNVPLDMSTDDTNDLERRFS